MFGPELLALGAFGLIGLLSAALGALTNENHWQRLGAELGLVGARVVRRFGWPAGIKGRFADVEISVRTRVWQTKQAPEDDVSGFFVTAKEIEIDAGERIPREIEIRAESLVTRTMPGWRRRDVEFGDPDFDELVYARGSELLLTALLDHTTRPLVFGLVNRGGRVAGGILRLSDPDVRAGDVPGTVQDLLETVAHLDRPADLVERLCAIARRDPQPGARLHALSLLTGRMADDPRVRVVCRELLDAPEEELRLAAATFMGEEGRASLLAIARNVPGDNPNAVRAIRVLGRRLAGDEAGDILDAARRADCRGVVLAAIDALALIGDGAALRRLPMVRTLGDAELAVGVVTALGRSGNPAAEGRLISALDDERPSVIRAAVEALGRVGTVAAIPWLRRLAEGGEHSLRGPARQAMAAIQSRLPGASPGQLSIATGEEGQLSMADDRGGRVALSADPREGDS